jgi:TetR/AcrR family transcriptional regulator
MADKSSRRAPTSDERQRDPERTREALLDAALHEFAAKGLAGARVSAIALRAGVNKQLISYYFGGKDGLYQALAERWLESEEEFAPTDLPLPELMTRYVQAAHDQRGMTRIFLREAIDDTRPEPSLARDEDLEEMRRRQREGEIAGDLDPRFVFLALQCMATAGAAMPAEVRRLTGLDPESQEFADRYGEQLRRIVAKLAEPSVSAE